METIPTTLNTPRTYPAATPAQTYHLRRLLQLLANATPHTYSIQTRTTPGACAVRITRIG